MLLVFPVCVLSRVSVSVQTVNKVICSLSTDLQGTEFHSRFPSFRKIVTLVSFMISVFLHFFTWRSRHPNRVNPGRITNLNSSLPVSHQITSENAGWHLWIQHSQQQIQPSQLKPGLKDVSNVWWKTTYSSHSTSREQKRWQAVIIF